MCVERVCAKASCDIYIYHHFYISSVIVAVFRLLYLCLFNLETRVNDGRGLGSICSLWHCLYIVGIYYYMLWAGHAVWLIRLQDRRPEEAELLILYVHVYKPYVLYYIILCRQATLHTE